jgi:hypothetical protein|tara:strand:- start:631 stop:807 length:177 start_codon:yes stop_codon:yes gene_type:complete
MFHSNAAMGIQFAALPQNQKQPITVERLEQHRSMQCQSLIDDKPSPLMALVFAGPSAR